MEQVTSVIGAKIMPMVLSFAAASLAFGLLQIFTKRGLVRTVGAIAVVLLWLAWMFNYTKVI